MHRFRRRKREKGENAGATLEGFIAGKEISDCLGNDINVCAEMLNAEKKHRND